jgi:hypothetical protein
LISLHKIRFLFSKKCAFAPYFRLRGNKLGNSVAGLCGPLRWGLLSVGAARLTFLWGTMSGDYAGPGGSARGGSSFGKGRRCFHSSSDESARQSEAKGPVDGERSPMARCDAFPVIRLPGRFVEYFHLR